MIKVLTDINGVKSSVKALEFKKVLVTQNLGRNKFVSYLGRITGIYPALFTVSPDLPFNGKTSFSYSEIMCGNVKLSGQKT